MEFETLTADGLRKSAGHLVESYPEELDSSFIDKFVQFIDISIRQR